MKKCPVAYVDNLSNYIRIYRLHICTYVLSSGSQSVHKVFIKNYDKLMSINIVNLSKYFVSENVITIEDEEEILSASRDKARLFLFKIGSSLKTGFTDEFNIMLDVMLKHGNVTDIQLAKQIKNEIKEYKNGKYVHSYCLYK